MNFLLSGYYGFGNAGDEAVLAAMVDALGAYLQPPSSFTVTSGDPLRTDATYRNLKYRVYAIRRQHPQSLLRAIKSCDVFISGGGSLLQDVTSVRNVVYYTSLMHLARLSRKPVMVYAQGVGPLHKPISQKLARAAMQGANIVIVRDPASKELLGSIGVQRDIEVTADPVWALDCETEREEAGILRGEQQVWCVSLRSWLHVANDAQQAALTVSKICKAARAANARLRFLPMEPSSDGPLIESLFGDWADPQQDEIIKTARLSPRQVMAEAGRCHVMIGMRLHALIFAAAQNVPCVAINYDPKVAALASIIGAPLIESHDLSMSGDVDPISNAVAAARPPDPNMLMELKNKALRNAELAMSLV